MVGIFFYLAVLCAACITIELFRLPVSSLQRTLYFNKRQLLLFLFSVSPIILIYTIRYGIGTDYFSYRTIFSHLHNVSFEEYIKLHKSNVGSYYVEPAYFVLNRYLAFSFGSLLFLLSLLMLGFIYYGSLSINQHINPAFAVFIYFCTQFIYSMNAMRFAVAVTIVFFGIQFILQRNVFAWGVCILLGFGFHKTTLICAPLYFLTNFTNKTISSFRNIVWYVFVLGFPIIAKFLLLLASNMSVFSRYFSTAVYALGDFHFGPMFLFHIVPVFLPLFIVKKNFLLKDKKAVILLRIVLFEIPLRELGSFNTWLSRLARFPQMVQVVLIPYAVQSVKNPRLKFFLKIYYIVWYVFYFIYDEFAHDAGDSLPYRSIFSNGGLW